MSAKACGIHHHERRHRHLIAALLIFTALVLFVILLIYLILHPTKPQFILENVTVYSFNATSPHTLTSNIQVTLISRNPNKNIGIYYEKLDVYGAYHGLQITLSTRLPNTYQGHKDVSVWSPFLYGNEVPIAPYLAAYLGEDQMAGVVLIKVKAIGRVRWKVSTFVSGRYRLNVNCNAYISLGSKNSGFGVGHGVKYQLSQKCNVDI